MPADVVDTDARQSDPGARNPDPGAPNPDPGGREPDLPLRGPPEGEPSPAPGRARLVVHTPGLGPGAPGTAARARATLEAR